MERKYKSLFSLGTTRILKYFYIMTLLPEIMPSSVHWNWEILNESNSIPSLGAAVASQGTESLDVFTVGAADARLYWSAKRSDTSGWKNWESLGGRCRSYPAAISWGVGRLDVFVKGIDDHLYHNWIDDPSESFAQDRWQNLHGTLISAPTVSSWAEGRLDVFVIGAANHLFHKYNVLNRPWTEWEDLGGPLKYDPAAVSSDINKIDVVAVGQDSFLNHTTYNKEITGDWSVWWPIDNYILKSSPAIISTGPRSITVFATILKGDEEVFCYRNKEDNKDWSEWQPLTGRLMTGDANISAVSWDRTHRIDVFAHNLEMGIDQYLDRMSTANFKTDVPLARSLVTNFSSPEMAELMTSKILILEL